MPLVALAEQGEVPVGAVIVVRAKSLASDQIRRSLVSTTAHAELTRFVMLHSGSETTG